MGERTEISWCDHTFNPVWGCTKVSPACDHCYAEAWDKRTGGAHWGPHAPFREFGQKHWDEPLKWDAAAERDGMRRSVFCASMADVFDKRWPPAVRPRLWSLIRRTRNLDWLLLTKRPENVTDRLPEDWDGGRGYPNVMPGVTVESAQYLGRAWKLLGSVGDKSRIFISYEPALGPLGRIRDIWLPGDTPRLSWIICGGESGGAARPMHPAWARDARDQCAALGIAFHFKQWGEWTPGENVDDDRKHPTKSVNIDTGASHDCPDDWAQEADYGPIMYRLGKKAAGRRLDGREHNAFPEPHYG
jgi:protein gp37